MPIFEDLALNIRKLKSDLKSASSKLGRDKISFKITKFILFGPKCVNLGIWAANFQKQKSNLKLAPSIEYRKNFAKIRKFMVLAQNAQIWGSELQIF